MINKRTVLLGWAVVLLVALFLGRTWLPTQLGATATPPSTAAAPASLPAEERQAIRDALDRITRGGPFLHAKDGAEFSNREGRLPPQAAGYYREYSVETPGSPDRGARRIVTGAGGDLDFTDDHYRTFVRLN